MLQYPVVTPENVRFHYTLAGPGTRLLALVVDAGVLTAALLVLSLGLALVLPLFGDYAAAVYGLLSSGLVLGFWIGFELRWNGQTPGKRLLGLRVVGDQGLRLEPSQVVLRNVLRIVDVLPGLFGAGGLVSFMHPEHRRIGDIVAGTLVIREAVVPPPERLHDALERAVSERALSDPAALAAHAAVRSVSSDELALLQELISRRDALAPAARFKLFRAVASHYRQLLAIELAEGQSDERFVLSVAEGLLGR